MIDYIMFWSALGVTIIIWVCIAAFVILVICLLRLAYLWMGELLCRHESISDERGDVYKVCNHCQKRLGMSSWSQRFK